ncbi:MAG: hypothetical protein E5V89_20320 [Mesorhizobium sp.]|nr:MAG: hypothetical protein E5V89_20320 [Mesorhizobium sp.]
MSGSVFHGNAEPLYLFVFTQFRTENRYTFFLELLHGACRHAGRLCPQDLGCPQEYLREHCREPAGGWS